MGLWRASLLRILDEVHEGVAWVSEVVCPVRIAGVVRDDFVIEATFVFPHAHEPAVVLLQIPDEPFKSLWQGACPQHPRTVVAIVFCYLAEPLASMLAQPEHHRLSHMCARQSGGLNTATSFANRAFPNNSLGEICTVGNSSGALSAR